MLALLCKPDFATEYNVCALFISQILNTTSMENEEKVYYDSILRTISVATCILFCLKIHGNDKQRLLKCMV